VAFSKANEWMLEKIGPAVGASGLQPPYGDIAGDIANQGGAMAINSMPVVPGPGPDLPPVPMPVQLQQLAFESLGEAFNTAFLLAGICALLAAALTLFGLFGHDEPSSEVESGEHDEELAPAQ
jgi:hypothetical protein